MNAISWLNFSFYSCVVFLILFYLSVFSCSSLNYGVTLTNLPGPQITSEGANFLALCMSLKPRFCRIWRGFGQAGVLMHPMCTEQAISIQSREATGSEWPTAEEKSPQPAKATLTAPTQPLWVLMPVSGYSILL